MAIVHSIPPGARLGKGIDIDLGENYGTALEFEPATTLLDESGISLGQDIDFQLTQITSTQELMKSLKVSASASLGVGPFSGSAEATYVSQQQVNRYSIYLLASVTVLNPERVINNPQLTSAAYSLLQSKGWDAFEQQYGPQYLSGVHSGGSYHALISINASSKQEQTEIAVAVSASYKALSTEGEYKEKLAEATANKTLSITILQRGGSGDDLGKVLA